jgi:hypothetical protein
MQGAEIPTPDGSKKMNNLDTKIQEMANAYFTAQGLDKGLILFKLKELEIVTSRGYNTRSEIISLLKKAGA